MSAMLVFQFAPDVTGEVAVHTVAQFFGLAVSTEPAGEAVVPAYIKQAVENTAAYISERDNPANGVELSPAIAFGGLVNGAAGNVQAASQPSAVPSADAATLPTAPVVNPAISATLPPASSAVAVASPGTVAPSAPVAPANPAAVEFDSTGLPWDARIHSGAKSKTAKGEWRAMKGCDKNLIKTVELELRAKYPNGASGNAAPTAPAAPVSNTSVVASPDKTAALAYADAQARRVAGQSPLTEELLQSLLAGKPATLTPSQNDWYGIYYAKRNAAYAEFMAGNVKNAPVAPAAPAAPAAPLTTGDAANAQPGVPSLPDASQTAGVTQPPAAPIAPPSDANQLDAAGLPWDARINLPAKIKDTQGVWVQRFDVSGEVKLAVMAELRGNAAAAQSSGQNGANGSTPAAPIPPIAPVAVTAEQASADFAALTKWIVMNQIAGRITATAGPEAARDLGFANPDGVGQVLLMRERPEAWQYVVQILQSQGAI